MKSPLSTLVLRIPVSLHRRLKEEARLGDVSLNKHCRALLSTRPQDACAVDAPPPLTLAPGRGTATAGLQDLALRALEILGDDVEGLVLFGSFARGRQTADSDIDLLVVLDGKVKFDRDVYERGHFGRFAGHKVAPLFVQIPGAGERIGGLWFEVALDGIVLFDRDLDVSRFLSKVKHLIADGRVKRKITHGHPYWVHEDKEGLNLASGGGS